MRLEFVSGFKNRIRLFSDPNNPNEAFLHVHHFGAEESEKAKVYFLGFLNIETQELHEESDVGLTAFWKDSVGSSEWGYVILELFVWEKGES